ncbi:hypothetical protein E4T56_gene9342 [Termitomyces sp. T112]|nr:hypothetical protein E4T56_gene9342 [Termitomyces sp. T112]
MVVGIHLVTDENAFPSFTRYEKDASPEERAEYMTWSERYFEALYKFAPEYQHVIRAGKDARHLWFALRSWKGDDAEDFFGKLGRWSMTMIHGTITTINTFKWNWRSSLSIPSELEQPFSGWAHFLYLMLLGSNTFAAWHNKQWIY